MLCTVQNIVMAGNKGAQQLLALGAAAASAAAGYYFYSENFEPKPGHPGQPKEASMSHPESDTANKPDLTSKLPSAPASQHVKEEKDDSEGQENNDTIKVAENDQQKAEEKDDSNGQETNDNIKAPEDDKQEAEDSQEHKDLENAKAGIKDYIKDAGVQEEDNKQEAADAQEEEDLDDAKQDVKDINGGKPIYIAPGIRNDQK